MGCPLNAQSHAVLVQIFTEHPRYSRADEAIRRLIDAYPRNQDPPEVLCKVVVIQELYATPIYDVVRMAKHILSRAGLDTELDAGDPGAVERIRTGHGIPATKGQKDRNFYSFATKYCSFHNPKQFPIYDNYLEKLLWWLGRASEVVQPFRKSELKDYGIYKKVLNAVADTYSLPHDDYKNLDMGLWVLAKYRTFRNGSLSNDDQWLKSQVESKLAELANYCHPAGST